MPDLACHPVSLLAHTAKLSAGPVVIETTFLCRGDSKILTQGFFIGFYTFSAGE